ncbi:MAG: DUF4258 domain-containing protein [Chloroflexi bacterium]|nr:DUF4258 domain-containing protein [Chloroflexota bacterium]
MPNREYKDIIFTEHALERSRLRRISQEMVLQTIKSPERSELEDDGDTKFIREINDRNVHVVSRFLDDERKWLIISAWVRGEDDPKPLWQQVLLLPVRLIRGLIGLLNRDQRRSQRS